MVTHSHANQPFLFRYSLGRGQRSLLSLILIMPELNITKLHRISMVWYWRLSKFPTKQPEPYEYKLLGSANYPVSNYLVSLVVPGAGTSADITSETHHRPITRWRVMSVNVVLWPPLIWGDEMSPGGRCPRDVITSYKSSTTVRCCYNEQCIVVRRCA